VAAQHPRHGRGIDASAASDILEDGRPRLIRLAYRQVRTLSGAGAAGRSAPVDRLAQPLIYTTQTIGEAPGHQASEGRAMRAARQAKGRTKAQADPQVRLGGWLAIPEPLVVEVAGRAGYDWVGLDLQHGAWDLGTAFRGIQLLDLLGVPILVRVSEEDLPLIPRVLDQGASGIVVAMASSPEIVAAAIDRARYAPHGHRSYGGQRLGMRAEPADLAEVRPAIYAMLEDRRGVEAAREIAAVPGLAGLHIGPVDLGLGLGLGRDRSQPAFTAALEAIIAAGHGERLPVVLHAVKPS